MSQVIKDSGSFYLGTLLASAFVFHLRVQLLASDSEPHSYPASREKKRRKKMVLVLALSKDTPAYI